MISIDEGRRRVASYATPIAARETILVCDALRRILSHDIRARIALPRFNQSAMDGYALAATSLKPVAVELPISCRLAAGDSASRLRPGTAARIFTGAPIPYGADTVVMQEQVQRRGEHILVDGAVYRGSNIRRRGEDIAEGELLLRSGQSLAFPHLALLAAQGISSIDVVRKIRVVFFSTGNEIRRSGEPLGATSSYDSNLPTLVAMAREAGLDAYEAGCVEDDEETIANRLSHFATSFDLIVTSGGASVGDEDHSHAAMVATGATVERLTLAMKPGKPALAGCIGSAVYLGLPGNPVACMVSWLFLGGAVLGALNGIDARRPHGYPLTVVTDFNHAPGRTEFVPARVISTEVGATVEILGRGGPSRLRPLIDADGLAEISSTQGQIMRGSYVKFHPFRNGFSL